MAPNADLPKSAALLVTRKVPPDMAAGGSSKSSLVERCGLRGSDLTVLKVGDRLARRAERGDRLCRVFRGSKTVLVGHLCRSDFDLILLRLNCSLSSLFPSQFDFFGFEFVHSICDQLNI